jgi:hypothetical protein
MVSTRPGADYVAPGKNNTETQSYGVKKVLLCKEKRRKRVDLQGAQ